MRGAVIYSIQAEDAEATRGLQMRFYLMELDRQAEICSEGIGDALRCAVGDNGHREAWRHLQGALFAGIVVHRLLTGAGAQGRGWRWLPARERRDAARAAASARATALRSVIQLKAVEGTALAQLRNIRDSLEHVDERIDERMSAPDVRSLADWYITDGLLMASEDGQGSGLRALDPEMGLLYFNLNALDLFSLDLFMLTVRANAQDALENFRSTAPKGARYRFAGQAWQLVSQPERQHDWQSKRKALTDSLAERTTFS